MQVHALPRELDARLCAFVEANPSLMEASKLDADSMRRVLTLVSFDMRSGSSGLLAALRLSSHDMVVCQSGQLTNLGVFVFVLADAADTHVFLSC